MPVRLFVEKGFCLQGDLCKFAHGSDAVVMTDMAGLRLPGAAGQSQTSKSTSSSGALPVQSVIGTNHRPVRPPVPNMGAIPPGMNACHCGCSESLIVA